MTNQTIGTANIGRFTTTNSRVQHPNQGGSVTSVIFATVIGAREQAPSPPGEWGGEGTLLLAPAAAWQTVTRLQSGGELGYQVW